MFIKLQKILVLGVVLFGSVSCSQTPVMKSSEVKIKPLSNHSPLSAIGDQKLNRWLSSNQQSIVLKSSPWGRDVKLVVLKQYYSAAGNQCKLMDVQPLTNQALVCRSGQAWQKIRSFN